jgi:hypothetical protein
MPRYPGPPPQPGEGQEVGLLEQIELDRDRFKVQRDTLYLKVKEEVERLRGIAASEQLITPANKLILGFADDLEALLEESGGEDR